MARKTEGVKMLVQDILAARFSEIYDEDLILNICKAIEDNPEWRRRYDELSDDLRGWVVNNWIGRYAKAETGLHSLREVSAKGKSNIITAYTKLGHNRT